MPGLEHRSVVPTVASRRAPLPAAFLRERVQRAPDVTIGWTADGDGLRIAIAGGLRSVAVSPLTARLRELVWQFPGGTVELDLGRVAVADVRAINVLVELERCCEQSGSRLVIARRSAAVDELLRVHGRWATVSARRTTLGRRHLPRHVAPSTWSRRRRGPAAR